MMDKWLITYNHESSGRYSFVSETLYCEENYLTQQRKENRTILEFIDENNKIKFVSLYNVMSIEKIN